MQYKYFIGNVFMIANIKEINNNNNGQKMIIIILKMMIIIIIIIIKTMIKIIA